MRIIEKRRGYFHGTHKGASITIERDREAINSKFYIQVRWKGGCFIYDGYAPPEVTTMAEAKREAIKGAGLSPAAA